MKRVVLTFGLISGAVSAAMMLMTVPFMDRLGFDRGAVFGYTAILLSFLLVFFGIRSYRDNVAGGRVTFTRAFTVGLLITIISSACYVATWEVIYFKLAPGFSDKYAAYELDKARRSGATEAQLAETARQLEQFKAMYSKPLLNVAMTFVEPFPVGLLVTLVSAAVLRRRPPTTGAAAGRVSPS
jgi:hypothetical protein